MSDTTSQTATRRAEARYTAPPTSVHTIEADGVDPNFQEYFRNWKHFATETHVVDIAAAMRELLDASGIRRQTSESTDSR